MVKYFLHVSSADNSAVLGLIYNVDKKTFTVGGRTRFEDVMSDLINEFFLVEDEDDKCEKVVERKLVQRNKVKFTIKNIESGEAFKVFAEMRKSGLTLLRTVSFFDLMR